MNQEKLSIETNAIPKANGSARVRLGDTEVIMWCKNPTRQTFPRYG